MVFEHMQREMIVTPLATGTAEWINSSYSICDKHWGWMTAATAQDPVHHPMRRTMSLLKQVPGAKMWLRRSARCVGIRPKATTLVGSAVNLAKPSSGDQCRMMVTKPSSAFMDKSAWFVRRTGGAASTVASKNVSPLAWKKVWFISLFPLAIFIKFIKLFQAGWGQMKRLLKWKSLS